MSNYFEELSKIDCTAHVEKKGKFSYLSWAWAVQQLGILHPDATWQIEEFQQADGTTAPYMKTEVGYFVKVNVRVGEVVKTQIHPVLDNSNKTLAKPNAFQINTSIQRCLVKAIALHGLALHLYAGEDLPMMKADPDERLVERLDIAASEGHKAFVACWKGMTNAQKSLFTVDMIAGWKKVSEGVEGE